MKEYESKDAPESILVHLLKEKKDTVTTAESLTGGAVSAAIVNVPGASSVLREAFVTYCNEAKIQVAGVPETIIREHTEISRETAAAMAEGIRKRTGADLALSTTGIAGPGPSGPFPAGLVFIGASFRGRVEVRELHLSGGRDEIRKKTVDETLLLGIHMLQ